MENKMMSKINIIWKTKAIYLLAAGLVSLPISETNASQAFLKNLVKTQVQSGNAELAKNFVAQTGIGVEQLFSPHWDAFFKYCDPLGYADTLNAMIAFAQGTLNQPFVIQVKADLGVAGNNIIVGGNNLSAWIEAAQAETFREKLKIFPEYQKKFNKYKAAAKVHEALNALDHAACIPTFNFITASPNCDQPIKEAYAQHLGNVPLYKNTPIINAIVIKVIDGGQPRADAERGAKIDIECQILTNLGIPQNHAQAAAQNIVTTNTVPVTALTNQLRAANNAIVIGGQDITDNVVRKVIQNNANFGQVMQATARINAVLGGVDNLACVPVFECIAASQNYAKSINAAYKEHVGNVPYSSRINNALNQVITDAIVTKVIDGRQSRADAERDAKIDIERQILTKLGVPQNHAQAAAQNIVTTNIAPDTALKNQLPAIVVEGHDITADVTRWVVQGIALTQATQDARVLKYRDILKAKAYGFSDQTCELLAIELEKGKTLGVACQEKLPPIHCAGKEIQKLVIQEMITNNKTWDKAYEKVAIDTHFANLKQQNNHCGLGLTEPILQQVAEKVGKKQFPTYEKALVASFNPILFLCEGVNIDITKDVLGLVYKGDRPNKSLIKATSLLQINALKEAYFKKNLGISEQECNSIAHNIILNKDAPVDAIVKSLPDLKHRNASLVKAVALKILANTRKDTAIHEAKVAIDEDFFATLNIGLALQQIKDVAERTAKGMSDVEALSHVIAPVQCDDANLTPLVATSMLSNRENYDTATKKLKITHYQNKIQGSTKGLIAQMAKDAATQFIEGGAASLAQALANQIQIPVSQYEGMDLRLAIANRMLQKMSLENAQKAVWIETATQDIQAKHPKLTGHAIIMAQDMFAQKHTKQQALEAYLKIQPLFTNVQGKIADVAREILRNNATIESAWKVVCLEPKIVDLKRTYPAFEEDAVIFMAKSFIEAGMPELNSLTKYLTSQRLHGNYCKDTSVIAGLMIKHGKSYKDTLQEAERQIVHDKLTHKGGWACLANDQFANLETVCLTCNTIEEGEEIFLLSVCPTIPNHLLLVFLEQVKYSKDKFGDAKESFLTNVVIQERIKKEHPNIVDPGVLKYIAKNLVAQNKVNDSLSVDLLTKALQSADIVLQQSKQPYPRQFIGDVAKKLLANNKLLVDEAVMAVRVDEQARYLKRKYNHLEDVVCQQLAKIYIDHDLEGEVVKQVINVQLPGENCEHAPLEVAQKILKNQHLGVEEALEAICIDRKCAYLKAKYNYLDDADCDALAIVFIQNDFQDEHIDKAIRIILSTKNYDVDDIEEMAKAILRGSTFKAAEDYCSYRKFIDEDRGITAEYARQIAKLKRQHNFTRDEQAFVEFLQIKFQLSLEQAYSCYNFYTDSKDMTLKNAVEKTNFVFKTQDALKNKLFYLEDHLNPHDIWDIAVKSFNDNSGNQNVILGLTGFLCESRPQSTPFAWLPCENLILQVVGNDYFSLMAKAIWENDMSIGGFMAAQLGAFKNFQSGEYHQQFGHRIHYGILEIASKYINGLDAQKPQQQQNWTSVFGDHTQSLPVISAIMMYKLGIKLTDIQSLRDFNPVIDALKKAVPIYLQHVYPDAAQQNLSCLQYIVINEDDREGKKEAGELCTAYYQFISGKMVKDKKNYQAASQEIRLSIQTQRNQIKTKQFIYLEDTHAQEIVEAELFAQKDRKEQAILRYIKENLRTVSPFMVVFGKKIEDLVEDKERDAYLWEFTQILSLKPTGEPFQLVCQGYQNRLENVARKLEGKVRDKISFLNLQNCQNMVYEVKMLKKSSTDVLRNILLGTNIQLPAIMFEKGYLSEYFANNWGQKQKRGFALNNIISHVGLTIEDDKVPLPWAEAVQAELTRHFSDAYTDMEEEPLYLPIIKPLSAHLAKLILRNDVFGLTYAHQMKRINQEKAECIENFLAQRSILGTDAQAFLKTVSAQMAMSSTHCLYALLEAKATRLSRTQQPADLYTARLRVLKEQGIIIDIPDEAIINKAVAVHDKVKEIFTEEAVGILPKATDLEVTLAAYHHAKKQRGNDLEEIILLEGLEPLHMANCVQNLQIIGLTEGDFSCPNFSLQRDLSKVAASKSLKNPEFNIFCHDGKTIGRLYRRDYNIIPTYVINFDKEIVNAHAAKKLVLTQEWNTLLARSDRVQTIVTQHGRDRQQAINMLAFNRNALDQFNASPQVLQWNQTLKQMGLLSLDDLNWEKHFENRTLLEFVSTAVEGFGQTQQGKIKINLETLMFDPWHKASPYDRMGEITVQVYDGLKNTICNAVTRHCSQQNILDVNTKSFNISRFFSWGQTSDMNEYLGQWTPFSGQQLILWRKRVNYACENVIFANPCTDKNIYERVAVLFTRQIQTACSNPAQDVLGFWEQQLPASEELTVFNKLANCLSNWRLGEFDVLVKKNYHGYEGHETEYGRFMKLVCKKPLSIFTNDITMDHYGLLYIYSDPNKLDHADGLSIKPFVHEFLKYYQVEMVQLIKSNISFKEKPVNDATCQIYFQEILGWASTYKKYCNLEEDELKKELCVGGKEIKEAAVLHLLSHAGYIDWDDKDK